MELHYVYIFFQLIAFLFAISIHESAHAWMASRCGDPTARMLGRITLNPLRHIDPVGTILLPAIALFTGFPMIGWAKPTPVDPRNFQKPGAGRHPDVDCRPGQQFSGGDWRSHLAGIAGSHFALGALCGPRHGP